MGYIKCVYELTNGKQISEHHNRRRCPKDEKRKEKKTKTPDQIRKNNQRMKDRKTQRFLLHYFGEGDKYLTLTYTKDEKPDLKRVQKDVKNLTAYLRKFYEAENIELKWCRNIERTKRGIYHIHMVINKLENVDVGKVARAYWKKRHGKIIDIKDMYLDGGFEELAKYISKTERDENGEMISSFSHSANIKDIEPKKKEYKRRNVRKNGAWKEIEVPKGYELVKESVFEGTDPLGFPVRHYTLIRTGTEIVRL